MLPPECSCRKGHFHYDATDKVLLASPTACLRTLTALKRALQDVEKLEKVQEEAAALTPENQKAPLPVLQERARACAKSLTDVRR